MLYSLQDVSSKKQISTLKCKNVNHPVLSETTRNQTIINHNFYKFLTKKLRCTSTHKNKLFIKIHFFKSKRLSQSDGE